MDSMQHDTFWLLIVDFLQIAQATAPASKMQHLEEALHDHSCCFVLTSCDIQIGPDHGRSGVALASGWSDANGGLQVCLAASRHKACMLPSWQQDTLASICLLKGLSSRLLPLLGAATL